MSQRGDKVVLAMTDIISYVNKIKEKYDPDGKTWPLTRQDESDFIRLCQFSSELRKAVKHYVSNEEATWDDLEKAFDSAKNNVFFQMRKQYEGFADNSYPLTGSSENEFIRLHYISDELKETAQSFIDKPAEKTWNNFVATLRRAGKYEKLFDEVTNAYGKECPLRGSGKNKFIDLCFFSKDLRAAAKTFIQNPSTGEAWANFAKVFDKTKEERKEMKNQFARIKNDYEKTTKKPFPIKESDFIKAYVLSQDAVGDLRKFGEEMKSLVSKEKFKETKESAEKLAGQLLKKIKGIKLKGKKKGGEKKESDSDELYSFTSKKPRAQIINPVKMATKKLKRKSTKEKAPKKEEFHEEQQSVKQVRQSVQAPDELPPTIVEPMQEPSEEEAIESAQTVMKEPETGSSAKLIALQQAYDKIANRENKQNFRDYQIAEIAKIGTTEDILAQAEHDTELDELLVFLYEAELADYSPLSSSVSQDAVGTVGTGSEKKASSSNNLLSTAWNAVKNAFTMSSKKSPEGTTQSSELGSQSENKKDIGGLQRKLQEEQNRKFTLDLLHKFGQKKGMSHGDQTTLLLMKSGVERKEKRIKQQISLQQPPSERVKTAQITATLQSVAPSPQADLAATTVETYREKQQQAQKTIAEHESNVDVQPEAVVQPEIGVEPDLEEPAQPVAPAESVVQEEPTVEQPEQTGSAAERAESAAPESVEPIVQPKQTEPAVPTEQIEQVAQAEPQPTAMAAQRTFNFKTADDLSTTYPEEDFRLTSDQFTVTMPATVIAEDNGLQEKQEFLTEAVITWLANRDDSDSRNPVQITGDLAIAKEMYCIVKAAGLEVGGDDFSRDLDADFSQDSTVKQRITTLAKSADVTDLKQYLAVKHKRAQQLESAPKSVPPNLAQ